jgi:hypothetical protein
MNRVAVAGDGCKTLLVFVAEFSLCQPNQLVTPSIISRRWNNRSSTRQNLKALRNPHAEQSREQLLEEILQICVCVVRKP